MIDLHNDALLKLTPAGLLDYLRQAKIDGVTEIWLSVWTTELSNPIEVITEKKSILDSIAGQDAYPKCHLHVEDAWFLNPKNLQQFIELHPDSVGLTWNHNNCLAGGALQRGKITPWGYQVIQALESAGIQVDTAHLNRRSFWQFVRVTTRPICCTHTAFHSVHHHPRNLTNRQIRTIIKSGGKIGLAIVPEFLTKDTTSCDIHTLIKHISYFNQYFPNSELAWGTDFYGTENLPKGIQNYRNLHHLLATQIIGYSVLHQPIIAYRIGNPTAPRRLLITAGMHAREWISSLALQTWLNSIDSLPNDLCLTAVICCNPDGAKLVMKQPLPLSRHRRKFLQRTNQNSDDFHLWKANLNAVDLNVNFDANWGQGRSNLTITAPANYIGPEPHSEPENRALIHLIKNFRPTASVALHTKGNVIYYSRLEEATTANFLAQISGFKAELSTGSYGGLTDYLAMRCKIPSFTVELGSDSITHPIGTEHLATIMPPLTQILNYFLTGE